LRSRQPEIYRSRKDLGRFFAKLRGFSPASDGLGFVLIDGLNDGNNINHIRRMG
jgi:hypothetical protein